MSQPGLCTRFKVCLRPEQEGTVALPRHEFGLDVIALVDTLRHAEHRSLPEIHAELVRRGVPICARSVNNLLDRYDELLALSASDTERLRRVTAEAGQVILARSLLSSCQADLAKLLREVAGALPVPIAGVVSDGHASIRNAVAVALKGNVT